MGRALKECRTAALHSIVPATGLPSYLTRVIDIVTIAGHGLMVVIHIRTDEEGRLVWDMLEAEDVGAAAQTPLASGSSFRFRSRKD